MANLGDKRGLPDGNRNDGARLAELDKFITLLPELYYAVNRVLEDCTPHFSKKVGVALWALSGSQRFDSLGSYLTTSDLVTTFREWFVVSESSAGPEVSKVKSALLDLQYIKIEGGADHIHLNEKGAGAVRDMFTIARRVLGDTVKTLKFEERQLLLDFAQRMIAAR